MRENRMCGSEGGEPGSTRLPYPYRLLERWSARSRIRENSDFLKGSEVSRRRLRLWMTH